MKRLFLSILACVSLFAMTSCEKNEVDPNAWIYGDWHAVEFSMNEIPGDPSTAEPLDISIVNATISFDQAGKASVCVPPLGEWTDPFTKTYDYSISGNALRVGEFDLTYEFANEQLKVYGKGEFLLKDLIPYFQSKEKSRAEADAEDLDVVFTFVKLPKAE